MFYINVFEVSGTSKHIQTFINLSTTPVFIDFAMRKVLLSPRISLSDMCGPVFAHLRMVFKSITKNVGHIID